MKLYPPLYIFLHFTTMWPCMFQLNPDYGLLDNLTAWQLSSSLTAKQQLVGNFILSAYVLLHMIYILSVFSSAMNEWQKLRLCLVESSVWFLITYIGSLFSELTRLGSIPTENTWAVPVIRFNNCLHFNSGAILCLLAGRCRLPSVEPTTRSSI